MYETPRVSEQTPLEREIHAMTRVMDETGSGSMSETELLFLVMKNVEALNHAVERLAREIDGIRGSTITPD
jgi:hypothetical protein